MEEDLRAQLLANAGVAAICGDRGAWGELKQGAALPGFVMSRLSGGRAYTLRGRGGLLGPLVTIECLGVTYADAKRLARAIGGDGVNAGALDLLTHPFRGPGFVEDERDDRERVESPDRSGFQTIFRTSLDVRVWHLAS